MLRLGTLIALLACLSLTALGQDRPIMERLGPLQVGLSDKDVIKGLGRASSMGKPEFSPASGDTLTSWNYPKLGLSLVMAQGGETPAQVDSFRARPPCRFRTAHGVGLGDSADSVRRAYRLNAAESKGNKLVFGDEYGGVIFTLKDGKVVEIFVGASAE